MYAILIWASNPCFLKCGTNWQIEEFEKISNLQVYLFDERNTMGVLKSYKVGVIS